MNLTSPTMRYTASLLMVLALALTASAQNTAKWYQGDVFLGTGGGQWKVFRPSTNSVVDSFSDGLSGATSGSAIDNTWHLIGTDSGNRNSGSTAVRFRVSPNDPTNAFAVTPVLTTFNSGGSNSSTNPKAVIVDAAGNMTVANANPATIVRLSPSGAVLATVPIANQNIDKALASADLDPTANVLYYTSGGQNINALSPISSTGAVTTVASLNGQKLFGLRHVPGAAFPSGCSFCPSGGGFLVAANSAVLLVSTTGTLLHTYTVTGQNSLQVVSLDPLVQDQSGNKQAPTGFWTASPSSNKFFRVDYATGVATQYTLSGASSIQTIATYAGLSANQNVPTAFPVVTMTGNPSNSGTFLFNNADQLTLTAYGLPTGFSTNLSVFANSIAPSGGAADSGEPCTPTISGQCTVWSADVNPPLPSGSLMSMKVLATQGGVDSNTRVFRDSRENITLGVANIDPIGRSLLSVYTLNQVPGNNQGCTYQSPLTGTNIILNNPGNITFRFSCSNLTSAQTAALQPRISIVQLSTGAAPLPYFPGVADLTGGTCCTIAKYRLGSGNQWTINVSFKGAAGTFLATTFDDSTNSFKPSAFDVTFTVTK